MARFGANTSPAGPRGHSMHERGEPLGRRVPSGERTPTMGPGSRPATKRVPWMKTSMELAGLMASCSAVAVAFLADYDRICPSLPLVAVDLGLCSPAPPPPPDPLPDDRRRGRADPPPPPKPTPIALPCAGPPCGGAAVVSPPAPQPRSRIDARCSSAYARACDRVRFAIEAAAPRNVGALALDAHARIDARPGSLLGRTWYDTECDVELRIDGAIHARERIEVSIPQEWDARVGAELCAEELAKRASAYLRSIQP